MSELTTLRAALAEARKTARKAAAAIRKAEKAAAAAAVADGYAICIHGGLYWVKDANVYEYDEINEVVGDFVGRLNPDMTIDIDADEVDEEVVDLLGLDTVPISTTASTQIHDDLLGIDFASVSTAEEAEPVPSGVRRRYNRNLSDYLTVGQSIYFNYCGITEYAAMWDGTFLCIQDLAIAGRRVKAPSTFAGRILEHLIRTDVAWNRKTASANGWTECYVKMDNMRIKLCDLALRA
jgi:hypothetical protein